MRSTNLLLLLKGSLNLKIIVICYQEKALNSCELSNTFPPQTTYVLRSTALKKNFFLPFVKLSVLLRRRILLHRFINSLSGSPLP